MIKKLSYIIVICIVSMMMFGCKGIVNTLDQGNVSNIDGDSGDIIIDFPRELFFLGDGEEDFLDMFEYYGGIVIEPFQSSESFWQQYPDNAGTEYLQVRFTSESLLEIGQDIEGELGNMVYLHGYHHPFFGGYLIERDAYTANFIFIVDMEAATAAPDLIIPLFDFAFPLMGVLEYTYRLLSQYDMSLLYDIVFYFEDDANQERVAVYHFLQDAPEGLLMRHR